MQAGMFVLVLSTTAYAPLELLQGWLADVARINPVTQVVEAARQGFIGGRSPGRDTWPGLVALAGLLAVLLGGFALRGMRRDRRTDAAPSRARATSAVGCSRRAGPRASARGPLRLHPPEPEPVSVAVVLGLVLRRDRLAALRAAALARRSSRRCSTRCATTASSATRSSGTGRLDCGG